MNTKVIPLNIKNSIVYAIRKDITVNINNLNDVDTILKDIFNYEKSLYEDKNLNMNNGFILIMNKLFSNDLLEDINNFTLVEDGRVYNPKTKHCNSRIFDKKSYVEYDKNNFLIAVNTIMHIANRKYRDENYILEDIIDMYNEFCSNTHCSNSISDLMDIVYNNTYDIDNDNNNVEKYINIHKLARYYINHIYSCILFREYPQLNIYNYIDI